MHNTRLIILAALVSIPILAFAAIDSQNKRQSAAGYFEVPDGSIDTAAERKAAAGYYSGLDTQDGGGVSTGATSTGGGIHIIKRKRRLF